MSEAVAWTLKWRALGVDIPLVSPQALAIAIRKTQFNSPNCPPELKEKARRWLLERGFDTSIDD